MEIPTYYSHLASSLGAACKLVLAPIALIGAFDLNLNTAFATVAPEPPPFAWRTGSYGISATSDYFTTNANYDDSRGSFKRLPGDRKLSSFETRVRARYSFSSRFSPYIGFGFAQVRTLDAFNEKTNSGLTEAFGGINYLLSKKWLRVVPEIEASYPITATEDRQTNPLTSDGVAFARAGVFVKKPLKYFALNGYFGFHFPSEGLAKRLNYDAHLEVPIANALLIGGGIAGYETVVSDELLFSERTRTTTSANAGSHRYWAYNPHVLEARGWIGFRIDRSFHAKAEYAKTIDGIRAAEGQSLIFSFAFLTGGKSTVVKTQDRTRRVRDEQMKPFDDEEVNGSDQLDFEPDDSAESSNESRNGEDALDATEKMLDRRN